jgi:hypothetical protein
MSARASATSLQFSRKTTPLPSPRKPLLNLAVEIKGNGGANFGGHDFHDLLDYAKRENQRMPTPEDDAQSVSWNAFCHSGWPASPPMIVTKLKPVASGPVNAQMRRRRRAAATPALCDNCFMLISHSRTGRCIRQRNRVLSWHPQITTEGASARCFV